MLQTKRLIFLPLMLTVVCGTSAWGQSDPVQNEPVFELSAFEVNTSEDQGYIASNAVSAYRVNLPIQEVPLQISVVTREFLDDIKAVNLEEALGYTVGVSRGIEENFDGVFSIRGLQAAFPKRNGFRRYYTVDMTNVERVEVVKGPASALFGEAQPGGIVNYVTKAPLPEPRYEATFTLGSYDYYRGQINLTGPLNKGKNLLYRLDASYLDRDDYRDWSYEKRTVIAPMLEWRPTKKTKLKFDIEYVDRDWLPPSLAPLVNLEGIAYVESLEALANSDDPKAGQARFFLDTFLYPQEPRPVPGEVDTLLSFASAFGMPLPQNRQDLYFYRSIHPDIPRTWSSTGPFASHDFESYSYTLEGNHQFSNGWSVRFVSSKADIKQGYFRSRPNRTRLWGDGFYRGQRDFTSENNVFNIQADLLIPVDLGWSRHNLIVGGELFTDEFEGWTFTDADAIAGNFFLQRYFEDSPFNPNRRGGSGFGMDGYIIEPTYGVAGLQQPPNNDTRQERETRSVYISDQISMFNERLKILAGLRYDDLQQEIFDIQVVPEMQVVDGALRSSTPVSKWSPQIGANYEILAGVYLYANYSESFSAGLGEYTPPNSPPLTRPPELGEGREFGIKYSLMDGKLSGTLAWFDISKSNVIVQIDNDTQALVDDSSEGFELDFAWQVLENFQVIGGYAYIDSLRDVSEDLIPSLAILDNETRIPGVPNHQASLWGKYNFNNGPLDGFSIGSGVQWMSDFRGGQIAPDLLTLDGFTKVDLLLSYAFDWKGSQLQIDLFVDNLLDEDIYYAGPVPAMPTNYKITVTLDF
ncbi:MAG: TonB-dependent siderophore receptor [Oceanipulchritudo sp.]